MGYQVMSHSVIGFLWQALYAMTSTSLGLLGDQARKWYDSLGVVPPIIGELVNNICRQ